jgi:acyl-CoA thioester hydrolase
MSAEPVFRRRRVVVGEDVDALGHVNNTVWVRFVVELADAHSRAAGFDWKRIRELGGLWIVRRHEIDYDLPALPGEELLEETWVESLRGARSVRCARFTRARDGAVLVRARTQWAFVDFETQRPRRIPKEILEAFTLLPAADEARACG